MTWKSLLVLAVLLLAVITPTLLLSAKPNRSAAADEDKTYPVLLELFTSEGCSSCPPADAFLKQLDDAGHLDNAELIAIEEHVDYWDHLGWRDPFSSQQWTARQEQYARSFGNDGIYTPQLVINGSSEVVGSESRSARSKIAQAAKRPGAGLEVSITRSTPQSVDLSIRIETGSESTPPARLWLAVAERGLSSHVSAGENEGHTLSHAAVLRSLSLVPVQSAKGPVQAQATVSLNPSWNRDKLRFVVFLQEPESLHVDGVAACSIPH